MADVYNPWQYSGEENVLEDGFAIKSYREQSDLAEDLAEGEGEQEDMAEDGAPEAPGGNPMHEAMSAALNTINQQADVINRLMSMVAPKE